MCMYVDVSLLLWLKLISLSEFIIIEPTVDIIKVKVMRCMVV